MYDDKRILSDNFGVGQLVPGDGGHDSQSIENLSEATMSMFRRHAIAPLNNAQWRPCVEDGWLLAFKLAIILQESGFRDFQWDASPDSGRPP